jgi:hypothetical protein
VSQPLTLSPWPQNDVERNIWRANALAAAVVIGFLGLDWMQAWLFEAQAGRGVAVGDAVAMAMLYTGVPHYVIAFVFMVTSSANHTRRRRTQLTGACLAGLALCALYEAAGGPPLPGASRSVRQLDAGFAARVLPLSSLVAVYVFFLVHEISDETSFLHRPAGQETARRFVARTLFPATVAILAAAGWIATAFGAYEGTLAILPRDASSGVRSAAAILPLVAVAFVLAAVWKHRARRDGIDARQIFSDLQPELRICLITIATIVVGLILTSRAYWMFLPHFAVWYLVARRRLATRPPASPLGWWEWMRKTRAGFTTLYASVTLAMLVVGIASAHLGPSLNDSSPLGSGIFVHATIFHITVSLLMQRSSG